MTAALTTADSTCKPAAHHAFLDLTPPQLTYHHDGKVQDVPGVAQVAAAPVEHKAMHQHLQTHVTAAGAQLLDP